MIDASLMRQFTWNSTKIKKRFDVGPIGWRAQKQRKIQENSSYMNLKMGSQANNVSVFGVCVCPLSVKKWGETKEREDVLYLQIMREVKCVGTCTFILINSQTA